MSIGIAGLGVISAWGDDLSTFKAGLNSKEETLSQIERFDVEGLELKKASQIKGFDAKKYIPKKNIRKYDIFSKLSVASSKLALTSLGEQGWSEEEREDMGVIFANEAQVETVAKYLEDLYVNGPDTVSPRLFSRASANTTGCHVAMEHGLHGISINLSSKFTSGFLGIYNGIQIIRAGQAENVIVGSVDYLSRPLIEIYSKLKTFVDGSNGANFPGEGSASIVLSENRNDFGKILDFSYLTSDINPNKWPEDVSLHTQVLKKACADKKIDYIFSADNGCEAINKLEKESFENYFGEKVPEVINLKNRLGECSTIPLFQIAAACMLPKETVSLISIAGPGGVHGALVVESSGLGHSLEEDRGDL